MLNFGTDKQEYLEFTLGTSKKVHKLPLAASMPLKWAREFSALNGIVDEEERASMALDIETRMLTEYVGDKAEDLPVSTVGEIFAAWGKANEEQGADLGE